MELESMAIRKRQVISTDVYEAIRAAILSGQIEPGSRIITDDIAQRLGTSNTPVRQALARLESESLVRSQPHKGYVAAEPLDLAGAIDVYDIRLLIEPVLAGRAASSGLASDDLDAIHASHSSATTTGAKYSSEASNGDLNFHVTIARHAGSPTAEGFLRPSMATLNVLSTRLDRSTSALAVTEHEAVLTAIRAQDATAAEAAMSAHLIRSRDRIVELLRA